MPVTIVLEKGAERQFDALSPRHRREVEDALDALVLSGRGNVAPVKTLPGVYRLRAGSHRVFFQRAGDALVVLLIERRDHAYKKRA